MFVILKCPYRTTLEHAEDLRQRGLILGLEEHHVLCPSQTIIKRVGKARERTKIVVPVIDGFIFVSWNGSNSWIARLEFEFQKLKAMRRCDGGYATCTVEEIAAITPDLNKGEQPVQRLFPINTTVVITSGPFSGIEGAVTGYSSHGNVRLKIKSMKMQISTLQLHFSMLALRKN